MAENMVNDLFTIREEPTQPNPKPKAKPQNLSQSPDTLQPPEPTPNEIEDKGAELIIAIEAEEFTGCTTNMVKRASPKVVLALYSDLQQKRMDLANIVLSDLLISKVADLLGGLEAIESSEELEKDLCRD